MQNLEKLERAILEAVCDKGSIGLENGSLTPAAQVLAAKYPSERERQDLTVALQYLLEERYLWPYFNDKGKEDRTAGHTRGITPRGVDRLRKLRHPQLYWMGENWFPLLVAATGAAIGLTNIVVNL